MKLVQKNTTRREFVKDTALSAASLGLLSSLSAPPAHPQVPRQAAADKKYGNLIKKMVFREGCFKTTGPGNCDYIWWPKGKELEGKEINFSWGYYSKIGDWHTKEPGGHVHPSDECLIFVGFDPADPSYLGAEIEFDVGTEYEKHVFREPMICCFPGGVVHCPEITLKCDKSYGFIVCGLDATHPTKRMPERSTLDTTEGHKYDHLYKRLVFRKDIRSKTGPGNADALAWHVGKDLENFNVNFAWGFYSRLGDWGAAPHKHVGDQFLVFVGLDGQRPDYLGAEIEIYLGEEKERHVIDSSTAVICPAGFVHGPIVSRRVEKTFGFYMIRLDKGDASEINPA